MDKDFKTKDSVIFISTFDVLSSAHIKGLKESTQSMKEVKGDKWDCYILSDKATFDVSNRFTQQTLELRIDNLKRIKPHLMENLRLMETKEDLEKLIQDNPNTMFIFFAGERNKMKSGLVRLMHKNNGEFRFKGSI